MTERSRASIKFEIVEKIGVLNSYPTGWNKEVNLVSWNDKPEKYDIRDWDPAHERMSRGVTLHSGEMKKLVELCGGCAGIQEEKRTDTEDVSSEQKNSAL